MDINDTAMQDIFDGACRATDPCDLERKILDPNIAKNEAEWWARERILELEAKIKLLEACIAANDTLINILKNELKDISEALNDPRVDITITMVDKIKELQEERKKHD